MKYLLLLLLASQSVHAVDLSGNDKKLHMAASGAIAFGASTTLRNADAPIPQVLGFGLALLAGYMKELCDTRYDSEDMKADAIGAAVGTILTVKIDL